MSTVDTTNIWLIMGVYLLVVLAIGWYASRVGRRTVEDYFLADRGLGPVVYFFTMAATMQSAFAFFGMSGMGYSIGFGAVMWTFLANCFTAFMLYFIGFRVWLVSRERGYISPSEFFADRYQSKAIQILVLLIMVVFAVPYLAAQPLAAGQALSGISQGAIPYTVGVWLLVGIQVVYTFLGGMRADAWSDTLQGVILWLGAVISALVILPHFGGLSGTAAKVLAEVPTHFSIGEGAASWKWVVGVATIGISTTLMAPQMFIRIYTARSVRTIKRTAIYWIPAMVVLQVPTVLIGVFGRGIIPDLASADAIMPTLMGQFLPLWLATLIMMAAFAAMMSTIDSILLTLSSMFTRDVYARYLRQGASDSEQFWVGRAFVLLLGLLSGLMAMNPPAGIVMLTIWSFSAFAMLFPATVMALYWRRVSAWGAFAGTLAGLAVVIGPGTLYPERWLAGFMPIVPALILNWLVLYGVSLVTRPVPTEVLNRFYAALDRLFGRESGEVGIASSD